MPQSAPAIPSFLQRLAMCVQWCHRHLAMIGVGAFLLFWTGYFAYFWQGLFFTDAYGSIFSRHVNVWGDWAVHLTMTTALAERGIGIASPMIIDQPFSYPFAMNLISALLVRGGVELFTAMTASSFVVSMFFVAMLLLFYRFFSRSWAVAVVAATIFLCNGGLGFGYFVRDIMRDPQPLQVLLNPPHEYTRIDDVNIKWISVIDSMMIPQRAFLMGFPLGLAVLMLVRWGTVPRRDWRRWGALGGAAVVAGFMPIIHTHTFFALFVILSCWSFTDVMLATNNAARLQRILQWGSMAVVTALIAFPLFLHFFQHNISSQGFLQWYPGWLAREYQINWLRFWLLNWGITPLLLIIASITWLRHHAFKQWSSVLYATPFVMLWILINLFIFQPWPWDNTKLLVWAWVGMAGLIGWGGVVLWRAGTSGRQHRPLWRIILRRCLIIIAFIIVIASGTIDAYRILRHDLHSYESYTRDELTAAAWVKANTPKNSIWLTPHPHNYWLFNLTGRQTLMGYPGWLWTQGYDFQQIGNDVNAMLSGNTDAVELLQKYHVDYAAIGPTNKQDVATEESFFQDHYPTVYTSDSIRVYKITSPPNTSPTP